MQLWRHREQRRLTCRFGIDLNEIGELNVAHLRQRLKALVNRACWPHLRLAPQIFDLLFL